ncbi:TetR/AcrR family transcriptional regulator [Desulfovibrio sp. JC010]|uniref:TetR/AcrR family transcriptional regulator n=1 Tax=Desulfovibrio sp. JC010 TaxID=2593641 RepID=UPI0013D0E777|nr:TetR/AcrR family transcriptional regulator [Desulfovibrio sp. JC010]NDV27037.1 TetR/AcrR family transcriptional regulator [Desulfovibrio sp. JC010]
MTRSPVQKRSREKKRKIIVAGMKLFSEKGFHETGVTELAAEAKVSVGTFYSYFRDKKDLLDQVAETYAASITKGVYGNFATNAPYDKSPQKIVEYITQTARQAHSLSTELHREMLALKNREALMAELDKSIVESLQHGVSEILNNCADKIRVKDIDLSARLVCGAIEETMHRCLLENEEPDMEKAFEELTEMCTGYLFKSSK